MKRGVVFITVAAIVCLTVLLCAAAPVNEYHYKTVLPNIPLFKEPSLNAEAYDVDIPQNAVVEPIGDPITVGDRVWVQVKYTTYSGYMLMDSLYPSLKNDDYEVVLAKATAAKMGEEIHFYESHSLETISDVTAHDGERVRIIDNGLDYGDFYFVEYNEGYYFVLKDNVTTGLSYNQLLAVIISASFVGALILAGVVVIIVKHYKKS